MFQIGKFVILAKREINELNDTLSAYKNEIVKQGDKIKKMEDYYHGMRRSIVGRINEIIDIIMPTLPIKKRKALAKHIEDLNSDNIQNHK